MGLGVSHDCFDGSYGSFTEWRRALALAAGSPPLDMMEGYYYEREPEDIGDTSKDVESYRESHEWFVRAGSDRIPARLSRSLSPAMQRAMRALPLQWDYFKSDPLTILLKHSDCEGTIAHEHLKPLAARLREILPALPHNDGEYGGLTVQGRTLRFIEGLMRAHELRENVDFR